MQRSVCIGYFLSKVHSFHQNLQGRHDSQTVLVATAEEKEDGLANGQRGLEEASYLAIVYTVSSLANFPQVPKEHFPNIDSTAHWDVEG